MKEVSYTAEVYGFYNKIPYFFFLGLIEMCPQHQALKVAFELEGDTGVDFLSCPIPHLPCPNPMTEWKNKLIYKINPAPCSVFRHCNDFHMKLSPSILWLHCVIITVHTRWQENIKKDEKRQHKWHYHYPQLSDDFSFIDNGSYYQKHCMDTE